VSVLEIAQETQVVAVPPQSRNGEAQSGAARNGEAQARNGEASGAASLIDLRTKLGVSDETYLAIGDLRPPATAYLYAIKPLIDRAVALVMLICLAPLMGAIAVAVRLSMGRGVIFTQDRVGRHGRVFQIYKFRTMRPDRRNEARPVETDRRRTHKHPQDPRVTRVGGFLRKWSLDELPQLMNVLQGDMSLVGPRPEMVSIVETYQPWQELRHVVKPGLTGLWQVSERGDLLMHECVGRDLEYIEQLSWRTDFGILARTPAAALGRRRGF
jgi:lipopolysaccharide/colanic/teichoic acid biosynthesis glycosyltransferase